MNIRFDKKTWNEEIKIKKGKIIMAIFGGMFMGGLIGFSMTSLI